VSQRFDALFTPTRIGNMELRNRLVMSPMTTGYGGADHRPTTRLVRYLEERARGGVGLITLEACVIDVQHREVPRSMHFADDSVVAAHRALTDRVHAQGARIQPQIVHPGPDSLAPQMEGIDSVGPSVIPSYLTGTPSRALDADELPRLAQQFAEAARRVREAGYDGLELHAAHGYMLLGSFLTPWRNRRSDAYAGHSLEGRMRFLLEVLAAIRERAGEDFPITLRVSGHEGVPGGRSIGETQRMAPILVDAGVAAFHVSGGVIDRLTSQVVTGSVYGPGHNLAAARALKQIVDVPVMVVGRIHDPQLAEEILTRGDADLVVMGRPLLADPELPRKLREQGRKASLRRCISCQNCIDSMETGPMSCAINGRTGRELELDMMPTPSPRRVMVLGGGPAGLEAARIAALRGHRVTLFERNRQLGGALVMASVVHTDNEPLLRFLVDAVRHLPVDVRLGAELDADAVLRLAPEVAIVATGGRLVAPVLPGDDLPHVTSGAQLRGLLTGSLARAEARGLPALHRLGARLLGGPLQAFVGPRTIRATSRLWMPLGRRVVIVGADLAAIELAEFLTTRGRRVTLVGAGDEIAPEIGAKRRGEHMDRLDRLGVSVLTGVACQAITTSTVVLRTGQGRSRAIETDSVILAGEVEPDTGLYETLCDRIPEVHAIGDCTGLGLIRKATEEAARVACAL